MAKTLRASGFTVIEGSDLDKAGMTALLDQFTEAAYDSEVALIYYAGHGLQVEGHNYLIPVDAELEKAAQLQTRTIAVDKILAALPPEPAISVVILDACRDNPLARSLARRSSQPVLIAGRRPRSRASEWSEQRIGRAAYRLRNRSRRRRV